MKEEKLFNVLSDFDFKHLENPEFQEDAVREEIVVPIIKGLGYSINKPNQIIRSRKLLHPFVSIGSKQKDIYIIPDYLLAVDDKPAWILDAKSPSEDITKSKNVEQAYSYAIHSEVRANFYALCNGREFILYSIYKHQPLLHIPLQTLPLYWENLKKYIAPENVFSDNHFKLAKDLGLHLKRLGFDTFENLVFPNVPITEIGQLDPDMFCISGGIKKDGESFVVTFDFDNKAFLQLKGKIPEIAFKKLLERSKERTVFRFADRAYLVNIDCKIGDTIQENTDEIFLPLTVNNFLK